MTLPFTPEQPLASAGDVIKLAVMAVGGQGGGVLTGWIEALARAQGYAVQATSVAGVAQRTGATIYYIEMAPAGSSAPVFSLAPAAGDVDVVIAAEMMEAGRAIMRGFVTPDRTTLIGSTHRALAVSEKMAPGDGIADADEVRAAAEVAARGLVLADFEAAALDVGSVISASLFGALSGSGALPFPPEAFEAAIRAGGKGVDASLRAFAAGRQAALAGVQPATHPMPGTAAAAAPSGPARLRKAWDDLQARIAALPAPVQPMAQAGLRKVVDFQHPAYGAEYLDRLDKALAVDRAERDWTLSVTAAKYLANAMAYDDVIRVADAKTRPERLDRIRAEMGGAEVMQLTEYTHPRAEEIVSLLPRALSQAITDRPRLMGWIDRRVNKGRRLRTDRLLPFLQLHALASMRRFRPMSLRHAEERAHLETWYASALARAGTDYDLAVATLQARRLIKGYSDTHARGLGKFDRVMTGIARVEGREDAADWARRLMTAALQDEEGSALDGTLKTIESFAA
ncbi:indolepyruvate oxidoreductase subunit beta family protein [Rhodobacter sp. NTK016B]|uniref:indolepyruvate oxidoreductase subunit beta family protein n=1 Tax=Rhodobacter sp. NTK016B TaxID=2759676 RepID=UPI001A901ABC|nr:indolepyruvate oxidoreductase subunit beta family protein [Rhodobacter sp. NTK016B]MBN8291101.1 indolepyruvate oxidoreductase subunit beta family protein [Rhodobacter sp. NTK016B]